MPLNRVTDQTTQNGLIDKYKLHGSLPEMVVSPVIQPMVNVGSLDNAQTVSTFEKWRSVFQQMPMLVDPATTASHALSFNGNDNIYAESQVTTQIVAISSGGNFGCALPGGSVGNSATDGVYRLTFRVASNGGAGSTNWNGSLTTRKQSFFGPNVALGTQGAVLAYWSFQDGDKSFDGTLLDMLFLIRTTDDVNALAFFATSGGAVTASFQIVLTKLIDEIPNFVPYS